MAHWVAPRARADLDAIWDHLVRETCSETVADQQVDAITVRFYLLAGHPYVGRARDDDLGSGHRSFPVGQYVIVYRIVRGGVRVLRVVHGRRDLGTLFSDN